MVSTAYGFKLMMYEITSAICCWVKAFLSPQGGIEKVGPGPAGVEPCWMNRSRFVTKVIWSELLSAGLIGLSAGHDPAAEPGFGMPPFPSVLWHVTQFAANICAPEFGSPVKLTAAPGPPGLDGRGTAGEEAVVEADVSVGTVVAEDDDAVEVTDVPATVALDATETGFKLITYAITSAICCGISFFWSPQAGIEKVGFGPSGVEPCSTNKSTL